jgi:hypothetical protein
VPLNSEFKTLAQVLAAYESNLAWTGVTPASGLKIRVHYLDFESLQANAATLGFSRADNGTGVYQRVIKGVTEKIPDALLVGLSPTQQFAVDAAMVAWAKAAGIKIATTEDQDPNIVDFWFGQRSFSQDIVPGISSGQSGVVGAGDFPGTTTGRYSLVFLNSDFSNLKATEYDVKGISNLPSATIAQKSAFTVLLHEVGHALGFKHPSESPSAFPVNWSNSVMSTPAFNAVAIPGPQNADFGIKGARLDLFSQRV